MSFLHLGRSKSGFAAGWSGVVFPASGGGRPMQGANFHVLQAIEASKDRLRRTATVPAPITPDFANFDLLDGRTFLVKH
jgi:hypothetical protein